MKLSVFFTFSLSLLPLACSDADGSSASTTGFGTPSDTAAPNEGEQKCGMNGNTVYALDCQTLQAQCDGEFSCADPVSSENGCSTWGECVPVAGVTFDCGHPDDIAADPEEPIPPTVPADRMPTEPDPTDPSDPLDDAPPTEPTEPMDPEPIPAPEARCGVDGDLDYGVDCRTLKNQCEDAGANFECMGSFVESICEPWGACTFPVPEPADPGPTPIVPGPTDVKSPIDDMLANVSVFECGEGKVCCLWVPGSPGDDCGGFLQNCADLQGTASGGNHVADCKW